MRKAVGVFISLLFFVLLSGLTACGGGGAGGNGGGGGVSQPTELQLAQQDAANIAITYNGGDSIGNVTGNIILPVTGGNGSVVTWESNNSAYLDAGGIVNRPAFGSGNQTVILTATIVNGSSSVKKDFIFTILETPQTDSEAVAQAKAALSIGFAEGDSDTNVTQNLVLGLTGLNGTVITWSSNNTGCITNSGTVTPPAFNSGHETVVLTATIRKNGVSDNREFTLTVREMPPTDMEAVAQVIAALNIGYSGTDNASSITLDVSLITSGSYNTAITWESDNPLYITNSGNVYRPSFISGDKTVKLTATISRNGYSDKKEFNNLTVIKNAITDAESISLDAGSLVIGYNSPDTDASSITTNLTLATSGSNGTTISWSTTNSSFIDNMGNVTRPVLPDPDAVVTLTATISKGEADPEIRIFDNLTVIARPLTDQEAVTQAETALTVGYASGDSAASVTQAVILSGSGSNGTNITWATSNESYITISGSVTRPPFTTGNQSVKLTATITKNAVTAEKEFDLIVIALPLGTPGVTITNTTENSVLTWPGVDGATSYVIQRYEYPGNWYFYQEITDTTFTYTHEAPLGNGSFVSLRICSKSGSATSSYTGELKAYSLPYTPVSITASTDQTNKIVLTWSIPPAAEGKGYKYRVYADDSATGAFTYACMGTGIYDTTALTCTITEFGTADKYFRVVAVNSTGTVEGIKSEAALGRELPDSTPPVITISDVNGSAYSAGMSFSVNTAIRINYSITDNSGGSMVYSGCSIDAGQSVNMSGRWSESPSSGSTRNSPTTGYFQFNPPVTGSWSIEIMWRDSSSNYARKKLYFSIN